MPISSVTRYTPIMSLHDNPSIEVAEDTYERIASMGQTFGKSPEAMLDAIVDAELAKAAELERSRARIRAKTAIDVSQDTYDRLDVAALAMGMTQDALLDMIIVHAIEQIYAQREQMEVARAARAVVTCSCCLGVCKVPLRWRGRLRCGCPNTAPDR